LIHLRILEFSNLAVIFLFIKLSFKGTEV
jgi:hypothetical protein